MIVFLPGFHGGTGAAKWIIVAEATLAVCWLVMVGILISNALVCERIHTTAHWHLSVVCTTSHHLILCHDLWVHASGKLLGILLLLVWLLVHI